MGRSGRGLLTFWPAPQLAGGKRLFGVWEHFFLILSPPPPAAGPAPFPEDIPPSPAARASGCPMEETGLLCGLRAGWGRSRAAAGPGQALCKASCGKRSREPELEAEAAAGGAAAEALAGWDEAGGGRLWGQIASRGGGGEGDGCCYCCCGEEEEEAALEEEEEESDAGAVVACVASAAAGSEWRPGQLGCGAAAAAGRGMAAPPGYSLSDPGSNSERSADSPLPDDDGGCGGSSSAGPARAHSASPEWGEERFRVDRKKLEAMLQGEGRPRGEGGKREAGGRRASLPLSRVAPSRSAFPRPCRAWCEASHVAAGSARPSRSDARGGWKKEGHGELEEDPRGSATPAPSTMQGTHC